MLKRDRAYRLDPNYSLVELVCIACWRGRQVVRGALLAWRLGRVQLPLFVGRRVIVEYAGLLRVGRSCIFEDGVSISALSEFGVNFASNVTIGKGAIIQCTGVIARRGFGVEVGENSAIGPLSFIGAQGGVKIGSNVIMGPGVRIFSENHRFTDLALPIRLQGESRKGVVIGDDCWIGAGATIVDGVTIGTGCVIAAGAVVTRSVSDRTIVAGVPARAIAMRDGSLKLQE